MICKAVEVAMIIADGWAWMVLEVIQPNNWRKEGHGGVAGWQAPVQRTPSVAIFRVGTSVSAVMAQAFVLLMPSMLVRRQRRQSMSGSPKPNTSRQVLRLPLAMREHGRGGRICVLKA